jgi:alkanesulfonate monooxygenase SsuD/methylene tetrahydromethanopterin reductase-like flavin-dependent oxidoreductase (luciferase family)
MDLKFGLHFSCSSVVGDWPDQYQAALEQAKLAETLGFDCAVVSEHHCMSDGWIPSPVVLCGALAVSTTRMGIGTDIVVLPLHHPLTVAEDHLVLDNLSRGRAICGVGMGGREEDFRLHGIPFKQRVSRSEEAMVLIRRLMTEEDVVHEGRYFRIAGATATPRPVQKPGPPIWYGAIAEPGAYRAARLADALVIGPRPDLATCTSMRQTYEEELTRQGKAPGAGRVILRREAYIAEDGRTAWKEGIEPLRFQYSQVYTHIPLGMTDQNIRDYARDRFMVGGPPEFIEELGRYKEALGMGLVLFRLQLPKVSHETVLNAIRHLGEKVLPYV